MDPLTIVALAAMLGGAGLNIYGDKRKNQRRKKLYKQQKRDIERQMARQRYLMGRSKSNAKAQNADKMIESAIQAPGDIVRPDLATENVDDAMRPHLWTIEDLLSDKKKLKLSMPTRNQEYLGYAQQGLSALGGAAGGLSSLYSSPSYDAGAGGGQAAVGASAGAAPGYGSYYSAPGGVGAGAGFSGQYGSGSGVGVQSSSRSNRYRSYG